MKTIGIDFDNTIVIYDELFYKLALEKNLIPASFPKNKLKIRDFFRSEGKDEDFTLLQSEVYGNRILEAPQAPNIFKSLLKIKNKFKLIIISHKTRYPYLGPKYDLHNAALSWLEKNNFFSSEGLNLKDKDVFFFPTKKAKLDAINNSDCSFFVDDLPDILEYVDKKIYRILYLNNQSITYSKSWDIILNDWINLDKILDTK